MYDHVVATLQYDYKKESPRLGMGDVMFVCDYKKGNCSDLHSYLISLARNAGVPAYIEYGFPITGVPVANPVPLTGKIAGYHCWTWFYDAENGWTPLDASDGRRWLDSNRADIKDTLFGNLIPERSAVAMSRGRDLVLNPPQKGDPVNNFIYPYAEVEGKPVDAKWELNYERILGGSTQDQVSELLKIVRNQQEEIDKLKAASLPAPKAPQNVTTPSSEKITAYGFIRTDAIYDTSAGNPNGQFPQFVKSPDDPAVRGANDQFSLHPRLTRLGFNLVSPADTLPGWNLGGKIEFDFQNGGSESRPTPRARLLYVNMQRGPNGWRIGQDWDLISPLLPSPNDDSLLWNTGNLGDRRPQIRFTHDEPGGSQFAISLGLTGAIDAKDLDGNGVRDGEDSGSPHLQARYGWKNAKSGIGLWGFAGRERTTIPVAGKTNFSSSGFGIDWTHAFSKTADFKGEVWTGKNVSDFRGGIGQGIQTSTGNQVRSTGGWAEIGFFPTPKHRIAFGYGEDNPNDADISANGKTRNRTAYIHNKWTLGTGLELGLNYMYWTTTYKGLSPGIDHRFNLFLTRKF